MFGNWKNSWKSLSQQIYTDSIGNCSSDLKSDSTSIVSHKQRTKNFSRQKFVKKEHKKGIHWQEEKINFLLKIRIKRKEIDTQILW